MTTDHPQEGIPTIGTRHSVFFHSAWLNENEFAAGISPADGQAWAFVRFKGAIFMAWDNEGIDELEKAFDIQFATFPDFRAKWQLFRADLKTFQDEHTNLPPE